MSMVAKKNEVEEETKQEYRMGVDDLESEWGYTNPQGEGGTRLKKEEPKSPTETLPTGAETGLP